MPIIPGVADGSRGEACYAGAMIAFRPFVVLGLVWCGCASEYALVKRRDAIRAQRAQLAAPPADLDTFRSAEPFVGGLRWGMTRAEVQSVRGAPTFEAEGTLGYLEEAGPLTLVFFEGHLAQLKRFPPQSLSLIEQALTAEWGPPASDYDQASELEAARTRDAALTVTGLTLSALTSTRDTLLWFLPGEERSLALAQRTRGDKPSRLTTWATKETSVYLAAFPGSGPEVTLISAHLGPSLVHQREAAAH